MRCTRLYAIRKVDQTRDYLPLAEKYLVPDDLGVPMLFFGSMINRCGSLHTVIAREMSERSPTCSRTGRGLGIEVTRATQVCHTGPTAPVVP